MVELRFGAQNGDVADELAGIGTRIEALPDRVVIGTEDGDSALNEIHARGIHPELTREAKHARGRLPRPHRPEPRRMSAGRVVAVVGWHARLPADVARDGHRPFVNPVLFLVGMGLLLGALVDENDPDLGESPIWSSSRRR